jgi:hypothetical protein
MPKDAPNSRFPPANPIEFKSKGLFQKKKVEGDLLCLLLSFGW